MGIFIALGIALHNIPEGLAIGIQLYFKEQSLYCHWYRFTQYCGWIMHSLPLALCNMSKARIVLISVLTGLSTLIGTFFGLIIGSISLSLFLIISLCRSNDLYCQ